MSNGPRANLRMPWADPDQTPVTSAQLRDEMRFTIAALRDENERLRFKLQLIADQDPVELALDPTWAKDIARAALNPKEPK